jgi:NADH-quinone oxidoreductase subunit A
LLAIAVFLFILGVALVYELSTRALDWGIKTRAGQRPPPEEGRA